MVSKSVSSAELPRRLMRNTTAKSLSSSSSEDDETEATEQLKVLPDEESNAMVVTSISPTDHSVRPKLRAWRSYSGVSDTVPETKIVTLIVA